MRLMGEIHFGEEWKDNLVHKRKEASPGRVHINHERAQKGISTGTQDGQVCESPERDTEPIMTSKKGLEIGRGALVRETKKRVTH